MAKCSRCSKNTNIFSGGYWHIDGKKTLFCNKCEREYFNEKREMEIDKKRKEIDKSLGIRRNGKVKNKNEEKNKSILEKDVSIEILKIRYAKGEITE